MTARIVYSMNVSLDGYINSDSGSLDWANVDEEVPTWFNDRARSTDAFVYGRRLYETMASYWPTAHNDPSATPFMVDFAHIWRAKPKIVFSNTIERVDWNSRLVRGSVSEVLVSLRDEFQGELDVGGANLAAQFIALGLVDEYRVVVHPVILGGGTPFFPRGIARVGLRLTETHQFGNGAAYLGYVPAVLG